MKNRSYTKTRVFGPIVIQVLLDGQRDGGWTIHLLPQLSLAVNNSFVWLAIGLEWVTGTVNLGFAKQSYRKYVQVDRPKQIQEQAEKLGISYRQQELRFQGW